MQPENRKKALENATRISVKKEMGKPRITKSARITQLNQDTTRIAEQPSTTMPGTVNKIIPSPAASKPEIAQIVVDRADHRHRDFRIENSLMDEHGDDVRLKKGSRVDVTVTAKKVSRKD
jgi:hypothetical protein